MDKATLNRDIVPDFHVPTEVFVKDQIISNIGALIKQYGSRSILITTNSDFEKFHHAIDIISNNLRKYDIGCIIYDEIPDNPNTEHIDSATYFVKKVNCDIIIGFGGIDSINSAKAIAILMNNYFFADELFETKKTQPPVNLITIPSYPLYGFEILPMLYLTDIHTMTKKVYKNSLLFPRATFIDPQIATSIDDETTAKTAICTLSIATESVISKMNNGFINSLALRAIDLIFKNLPLAYKEPANTAPRQELSVASIMSGLSFSVAELSLSLAVSLALSSQVNVDIKSAMGVILPHMMEYNLTSSPGKYVQMSKVMDEDVKDITVIEAAIKAVEGVRKLEIDVDIPQRLSTFEINKSDFSRVAEIAMTYPFLDNAPRPLTKNEIETILIAAY
jgi:alcohol dehydrogenase class IV